MIFETKKNMRWINSSYLAGLIVLTLITIALHLIENPRVTLKRGCILEDQKLKKENITTPNKQGKKNKIVYEEKESSGGDDDGESRCDFYSGRWVFDKESYPLYEEAQCSFMKPDYACHKYGRKDLRYQHWIWKPHGCDLPRF